MGRERLTGWGTMNAEGINDHTFQTPVIVRSSETREVALSRRITELESRLIAHGICPKCDAEIVCDYRAGKATNHRCKCGWKVAGEGEDE